MRLSPNYHKSVLIGVLTGVTALVISTLLICVQCWVDRHWYGSRR